MRKIIINTAIFFLWLSPWVSYALEDNSLEFAPIVVKKWQAYDVYTLNYPALKQSPANSGVESLKYSNLDMQSRSLKYGIAADFSLGASNYQGVAVLLDGKQFNDPRSAHQNSDIPVTLEDIDKIKIIPSGNCQANVVNAIGGAVDFNIKRPSENKSVIEIFAGQYETVAELVSVEAVNDTAGLRFSFENQSSGGYYQDTDFKKQTAFGKIVLGKDEFIYDLNMGFQEKDIGSYDFYTPGLGYPSKEHTRVYLLNPGFQAKLGSFSINPNFIWRRHYDKFMLDKEQSRSSYINNHRTDVYTPSVYFQHENSLLGNAGLGFEYGEEKITSNNLGRHSRKHHSAYLDNKNELSSFFSWDLAFRLDDYQNLNCLYSGALNLFFYLTKESTIFIEAARAIRLPSFTELYYNDPTTIGDAFLKPEKSLIYRAGYKYLKGAYSGSLALFLRKEKNSIDWVKASFSQAKWEAKNITKADVWGFEKNIKIDINSIISVEAIYTYLDKRIKTKSYLYKYGQNYARHQLNNIFSFNLPFGEQSFTLSYKKRPQRDAWFLLDSHFSYKLNKHSKLFLDINNLLNEEYQEIEGIPQPGRWVMVGMRLEF